MLPTRRPKTPRDKTIPTVHVRVRGGYQPSVLHGRVGERLRIVFVREETAACSEHVVFPAFGKSAMLPPCEEVTLELVPEQPGEYEFTCQFGMLRGRLVVDGDADESSRRLWSRSIPGERADTALFALLAWVCSLPLLLPRRRALSRLAIRWRAHAPLARCRGGGVLRRLRASSCNDARLPRSEA